MGRDAVLDDDREALPRIPMPKPVRSAPGPAPWHIRRCHRPASGSCRPHCRLAPRVHDEHVVDRRARDGLDALRLDLVGQVDETRQVLGVAGRREAPGTENSTTVLPSNNSSVVSFCGPSLVMRVNLPSGILSPALMVIALSSLLAALSRKGGA